MIGGHKKRKNRLVKPTQKKKLKKRIRTKKQKIIFLFLVLFLLFLFWLIFWSKIFLIEQINFSSTKNISQIELESFVWKKLHTPQWYFIPQDNLILLNENNLIQELNNNFQIEKLEIKKKWFHELFINIKEKKYDLVWHEQDKYYYINDQGDIILTTDKLPKDMIIIDNLAQSQKEGRRIKVNSEYIQAIKKIAEEMKVFNIKISKYIITGEINTLQAKVEEGPLIYFNPTGDINKQIKKLLALKKKILNQAFYQQQYINIKFGDKVFYQ